MRSFTISGRAARLLLAVGAVVAFVSVPITASALPKLQGQITFSGVVVPLLDGGGAATNFADATTLTFPEPVAILERGATTGSFATLKGEIGTFNDLVYDPTSVPITPLWSVTQTSPPGTWTFDLETLTVETKSESFLNLTGTGTLHAPHFDRTGGEWTLSARSPNTLLFSFASKTVAIPNPEPGAFVLFATGLAVVAFALRPRARVA